MAFVQRLLSMRFDLGEGAFADGSTSLTLNGLRMEATVTQPGIPEMAKLDAEIYGMSLDHINAISTLGQVVTNVYKNTVTVFAGDKGANQTLIFKGTIYQAWGDFSSAPNVPFRISAQAGLLEAVTPQPSTNPKGSVAAADILKSFAAKFQGGMPFENNGVDTMLTNPHYYGDLKQQIFSCLKQARADWNGGQDGVFAIWPVNGFRKSQTVPVISAATGMIQYPAYTQNGLIVQTQYVPGILFGALVKVETTLKLPLTPNGQWQVYGITLNLSTLVPHGEWFSTLNLVPPGFVGVPPL